MKMKKILALLISGAMVLSLGACGDSASSGGGAAGEAAVEEAAATEETAEAAEETAEAAEETAEAAEETAETAEEAPAVDNGGLNVCLASEPATLDPALNSSVDGATMLAHLFSGLAKWAQDENGNLEIVPDAAEELVEGVVGDDGKVTYTYKLRDGLKWSDGKDVTAQDYVYAWNRAASFDLAADYGYMFEVVDGYADIWETEDGEEKDEEGNPIPVQKNPDAKLNVTDILPGT